MSGWRRRFQAFCGGGGEGIGKTLWTEWSTDRICREAREWSRGGEVRVVESSGWNQKERREKWYQYKKYTEALTRTHARTYARTQREREGEIP